MGAEAGLEPRPVAVPDPLLAANGRHTDAIDELILKIIDAKGC